MRTYKNSTKRNLFLVVALFISMSTVLSAQNVLGKINAKATFLAVHLEYFKDRTKAVEDKPDQIFFFNKTSINEMRNLNLQDLNVLVHEDLRLAGNKMFGSTLGSPEEEIIITIDKQCDESEEGLAILRLSQMPEIPFAIKFNLHNNQFDFNYRIEEPFFHKENESLEEVNERLEARGYYIARLTYIF